MLKTKTLSAQHKHADRCAGNTALRPPEPRGQLRRPAFGKALSRLLLWVVFLAWCAALGCGAPGTPVDKVDPTAKNLDRIGDAYVRATMTLRRPPENLQELEPVLAMQGKPEDILRSPNDGEDFVIVWGVELRRLKAQGNAVPVVAYEKKGKDGKRYVLRGRAEVILLTDGQLKAATFPAGYTPS